MSLGGYKFRGYTAQRPGGMSNTDWYLLIHKTRVKAFLDASAAANAGWVIDYTDGQLDFESTTGAIYRLDDLGYNYSTTFKRGSSNNEYFAICTFCRWTTGTADTQNGKISILSSLPINSSNSHSDFSSHTLFHRVGSNRISPLANVNLAGRTGLIPVGMMSDATVSSTTSTDADSDSYLFSNYNTPHFGYAIKDGHIISITCTSIAGSKYYSLLSTNAYQSMFNSSDNFATFDALNFTSYKQSNPGEVPYDWVSEAIWCRHTYNIDSTWYFVNKSFIPLRTSKYTNSTTVYPFSSVYTISLDDSNNLKCSGIGSVYIDLLATNTVAGGGFATGTVVANGNYICVSSKTFSNANVACTVGLSGKYVTVNNWVENIFVGWDPSNPDLNESSSWPVYNA